MTDKDRNWDRGWAGHDERQLRQLAALPLIEKLRWLEEAHRLVRYMAGATQVDAYRRAYGARAKVREELAGWADEGAWPEP